jgi:hypothetical protein
VIGAGSLTKWPRKRSRSAPRPIERGSSQSQQPCCQIHTLREPNIAVIPGCGISCHTGDIVSPVDDLPIPFFNTRGHLARGIFTKIGIHADVMEIRSEFLMEPIAKSRSKHACSPPRRPPRRDGKDRRSPGGTTSRYDASLALEDTLHRKPASGRDSQLFAPDINTFISQLFCD